MAKVISVMNEKGGCGKTAISLNLACGFANAGFKVLAIDNDPQHNLSSKLLDFDDENDSKVLDQLVNQSTLIKNEKPGFEQLLSAIQALKDFVKVFEEKEVLSLSDVLLEPIKIKEAIRPSVVKQLDVLPSTHTLSVMDFTLKNLRNRDLRLRQAISYVDQIYDVIIIDNSPFESALTYNSLSACYKEGDLVLIPSKMDYENWEGVSQTIQTTLGWIEDCGIDCDFKILANMVSRTKSSEKAIEIFRNLFEDRMFKTTIRYQAAPIQNTSFSNKILLDSPKYDLKKSGIYQDFMNLIDELGTQLQLNKI